MIRNFFSTPNVIGKLMIVMLFVGGAVFAGAFDGFVVEIEASSCCGGGTSTDIFSSSSCCDTYTKSCPSGCDDSASCGPDDALCCSTKGDEYDPEEEEGHCCGYDYDGNCDGR